MIVAANRKGDIVVREGQEDKLEELVRSFVVSYGLRKEMVPVIHRSLQQLVDQELEKGGYNETMDDNNIFRDLSPE